MLKKIRYIAEASVLHGLFFVFGLMPPAVASAIGGAVGRGIGPRLATSRKAMRHVEEALPTLSREERQGAIRDMWDNLGRVISEYPHLGAIASARTEIRGGEIVEDILRAGKGAVFIGGHLANWEILGPALLERYGVPLDLTYRAPNNPWVDALLKKARDPKGILRAFPKSRASARPLMQAAREGRFIGVLIDQKFNEGLGVAFFGREAMTNPVFVQLSQKYGLPLIPVQNERIEGSRFRITVHEPIPVEGRSEEEVIAQAHALLETWIAQRPGQWLWLHRRWGSEKTPSQD